MVAAIVSSVSFTACNKLFDVESPGRIADENLNQPDAAPGIVTGMSYDLASAMNGTMQTLSLAAGELWHGGSYNLGDIPRGIIRPEDINGEWATMMQARWVTEHGIERMQGFMDPVQFGKSALVARAYLLAGFANRLIGENVCETVHDGGAPEPNTAEFDRGIANFTKAIEIGTAAGNAGADIVTAAYAGRASLSAWKGDWAGAVSDATKVPVDFEYDAILMTEGANNETHDRYEYTVYSTEFADHPGDPRAKWSIVYRKDGTVATGANGSTPMYQQNKYESLGADVPLVKGTEMLVLRAEAALRNNDLATATTLMNQARDFYGMAPLTASATATPDSAWATLRFERGATTWLENRRLWDERRWFAETGPAHDDFLNGRDKCIPISQNEANSNPNIP
jgi:hypothetical protein